MTDIPQFPEEDDISLLDLLQTMAENLRLLVIGPIVVGLLALAGASLWPKTYESTAILKAEQVTASLMLSAAVLDPIAANLGYTPKLNQDEARDKLKSEIKASFNAKDKLLTLTTQADTPQAAQALAKAVLQQTYAQSQPRDSEKLRLQKQMAQAQAREKEATQTAQLLGRKMDGGATAGASEVAQGYAQMVGVVKESQAAQLDIERQLQGLDDSALLQEATLPTKHTAPKRGLVTIMATLAAGFALLLFVFIRQALRNASQDAESAQKISAIQAAWRKALGR
jgi:uncharacterized protein involved in exopolysaccharide biosynthesis